MTAGTQQGGTGTPRPIVILPSASVVVVVGGCTAAPGAREGADTELDRRHSGGPKKDSLPSSVWGWVTSLPLPGGDVGWPAAAAAAAWRAAGPIWCRRRGKEKKNQPLAAVGHTALQSVPPTSRHLIEVPRVGGRPRGGRASGQPGGPPAGSAPPVCATCDSGGCYPARRVGTPGRPAAALPPPFLTLLGEGPDGSAGGACTGTLPSPDNGDRQGRSGQCSLQHSDDKFDRIILNFAKLRLVEHLCGHQIP